jgi:XTP/dITP diphosphohydrolase
MGQGSRCPRDLVRGSIAYFGSKGETVVRKQLLVATHNEGKVAELSAMLSDLELTWLSLADLAISEAVAEVGDTFAENARLKAVTYAKAGRLLTLADDSGLEVDALDGRPGVQTARYGGAGLTAEARWQLLLREMRHVPWQSRTARFRCAIALAAPDGTLLGESEGVCEGFIALEPAGSGGFGYDPVFYLPDRELTMAQLAPGEKKEISHRGRAIRAIAPLLKKVTA